MFESKVRKVGTSFGILIPKEIVEEEKLKPGQKVQVSVIKKDLKLLDELFGFAKGAKPFRREHEKRLV